MFAQPQNRELLDNNGLTVWLDCPFEIITRRVAQASHRPLARDPEKFAELYRARLEAYRLADLQITIGGDDPNEAVEAILNHRLLR
jgi:shikimate kinase